MIAECLLFLVALVPPENGLTEEWYEEYKECNKVVLIEDNLELLIEHFDYVNLDTAYKIMWCESRGQENALRTAEGNDDSGLFQFIKPTWNWVAKKHDLPRWNEWVILRHGRPYEGPTSKTSYGFEFKQVQFSSYYNILAASLLAQDTYSSVRWTDWNSSKWCWGTDKSFKENVRRDFIWWQKSSRR